ncbi:hypothetical protein [Streptomyces sp. NPDC029721]
MTFTADDSPDEPWPRLERRFELSPQLLDRAQSGWERFIASMEEPSND